MPEGHSIHRLAAAMTELFGHTTPSLSSPQGRFAEGASLLNGLQAGSAQAWGKHFLWPFGHDRQIGDPDGSWLHVHLGLYGSWSFDGDQTFVAEHTIGAPRLRIGEREITGHVSTSWTPPVPRDTVRLRVESDHGIADLTGPNQCRVLNGAEVNALVAKLGPDPLRNDDGDRDEFIRRAKKRRVPLGQLVMDQSVVAGPGNIYRADCLFRTGISPYRTGINVSEKRLGLLWDDLVTAMNDGVRDGFIHTRPAHVTTRGDEKDEHFAVYHRTGRPCHECRTPISQADMAGRKLYWCRSCQR